MKLYTFHIPEDAAEGRLLPLVKRMLPELPDYAIRAAFDKRDVKQNGQRADRQTCLIPGAEVKLYTPEGKERTPLSVLYEDADLLVVMKPCGVSCEPDAKGGRTIAGLAGAFLRQKNPDASDPLLCHRLDNPTDGLLLMAKNPAAQTAMTEAFKARLIHKRYICLVKGTPQPEHRILYAWLRKDEARAKVSIFNRETMGALPIVTEYTVLRSGECARLEVMLHTGRTHQIRAQMAAVGHPLLGDDKYGDRDFNRQHRAGRLMLCAAALSFTMEGKWRYLNDMTFSIDPSF